MSYLIQTILIGIVASIALIFSSTVAGWIVWGGYLFFTLGLFLKGREYREKLLKGKQSDITGAQVLPPATVTVLLVLVAFLFVEINKFHLLWTVPLITLGYEIYFARLFWKKFDKEMLKLADKFKKKGSKKNNYVNPLKMNEDMMNTEKNGIGEKYQRKIRQFPQKVTILILIKTWTFCAIFTILW